MTLSRREFNLAAASVVAVSVLTNLGCDRKSPAGATTQKKLGENEAAELAKKTFLAGSVDQYRTPGVYTQAREQGVWLVSDGEKLLALDAECTHMGCPVAWNPGGQQFACPCHKSRYTIDGINAPGMKAKRPLERCKIAMVDTPTGPQVQIDPTQTFAKDEDADEFSKPGSFLSLI